MEKQAYIQKYGIAAQKACAGTPYFPDVMLAQSALESGWGSSSLASKYNNFFGIKADSAWTGERVTLNNGAGDPEAKSTYRVYATPEDGFRGRNEFLSKNPRYAKAGVQSAKTPREQVEAMKRAGYAEDPNYVSKIMKIIEDNNLQSLNNFVPEITPVYAIVNNVVEYPKTTIIIIVAFMAITYYYFYGRE